MRCDFQYLGNDAVIYPMNFLDPGLFNFGFHGRCLGVSNEKPESTGLVSGIEALYPNPSKGKVFLRYFLAGNQEIRVTISTILGSELFEIPSFFENKGSHELLILLDNYTPGLYILTLKAGKEIYSTKVIVE